MNAARVAWTLLVVSGLMLGLAAMERRTAKALVAAASVDTIDMGITLHVVRKAPNDGAELIEGMPRMALVRTVRLGGMVTVSDGVSRMTGPSRSPVTWYASEAQAAMILHGDDLPPWILIEGSEGAGKTTTLAMWLAVRALEFIGTTAEIGMTAPTHGRLAHIKKAIRETWPRHWYRYRKAAEQYVFHAGPVVQLVSAVKRSEEGGSPIQGYTWAAAASDELQDHFEREADIQARCRDPRAKGRAKRLCSSTPKVSTEWREFRKKCEAATSVAGESVRQWGVRRLLGMESPFIFDRHWASLRASSTMTKREWDRRVEAKDVGPERQVYFNWSAANIASIPPGAVDVTARELRPWGRNVTVLAGHDPGLRQHVTVFLKAFECPRDRAPRWFVVGEVTSPESTIYGHVHEVKRYAAQRWRCIPEADRFGDIDPTAATMLVRIDPATQSGEDHPGEDVFRAWRVAGLQAKPAAYAPGTTRGTPLKKRQRIDLVNTLLSAVASVGEVRRLFVEATADHKSAAPMLVKACESMETNASGKAEAERKDANDLSHWPAAVAFALWLIESRRLGWEPQEAAA